MTLKSVDGKVDDDGAVAVATGMEKFTRNKVDLKVAQTYTLSVKATTRFLSVSIHMLGTII